MTTPTPIETFEDILAAMENNPELQAAMRQHVLGQEFLQLPAIVRELQQTVAELAQLVRDYIASTNERLDRLEAGQAQLIAGQEQLESRQTRLEASQARLEAGQEQLETRQARLEAGQARLEASHEQLAASQARLEAGQAQLESRQARLEGNMNRLIGSDYERKAARRAGRLIKRYLGIEDMQVIYAVTIPDNNQLPEILDHAVSAGHLDVSEADELEDADIVMRGPSEYAVAEVSVTLDENDVQRAHERAGLLAKATTEPVRAVVIGAHALDSASQLAATNNVAVMILTE